jgi:exosortase family protein XrtF
LKKNLLKKYLVQFKPFLIFIGTFFLAYIVLTAFYKLYLNNFELNDVDGITVLVGKNVEQLMNLFNCDIRIVKSLTFPHLEVWYNEKFEIRIVEGCNAVSVIILFISFVLAFSGKLKSTLIFILFGIVLIYVLNVIRIVLVTVLFYRFPAYQPILHDIFFPLIIYGLVFILWIVWVNKFSKYAK